MAKRMRRGVQYRIFSSVNPVLPMHKLAFDWIKRNAYKRNAYKCK